MLKGFGGASTAHGINGSMTSLCLLGGNDCTPGSTPDLTVKGGAKIKKNLCVFGRTKLETLEVKGDASIEGNLTVGGDEMISGDLVIIGNAAICGNVYLKDEFRVSGDATFDSNVHVKGNEMIDGDVAIVGDAAICGNVYMKETLTVMGNLNACMNINVDCINEKTLNHGVKIEGVVIKDGMLSVPTPGIAACIQDLDLTTTVCVDTLGDPNTVTMTVNNIKKIHLHPYGGWEHGNLIGTNIVVATGEDAFASGQGTQNLVGLLGKTDIDGRTGVINLVASGKGAHAEGGATVASGDYAHAEGVGTQAVGKGSHAEGIGSKATGIGAHAEGDPTLASGNYSHAEGQGTTASGVASHSEGQNTVASGLYSHAEGRATLATANFSHSEGSATQSTAPGAHSEGILTNATNIGSHAEGYSVNGGVGFGGSTSSGEGSHVEGFTCGGSTVQQYKATGRGAHLEGCNGRYDGFSYTDAGTNQATGDGSHVEGYNINGTMVASGRGAHVEGCTLLLGEQSLASGDGSHAEGNSTNASGLAAHAEGRYTTASGIASHTEGLSTTATGNYSHAEGQGTTASGVASHSEGFSAANNILASGVGSHASGYANGAGTITASGQGSHAEGYATGGQNIQATGTGCHAEGSGVSASGLYSHAEGFQTTVSAGTGNHSEGWGSQAINGVGNHAEGVFTTAQAGSNLGCHSEGYVTQANGRASHAEGYLTQSNADFSHAEGQQTVASGTSSHAEGLFSTSSGQYSHAEGFANTASGSGAHVEGQANVGSGISTHVEGFGNNCAGDYCLVGGRAVTVASGHNASFIFNAADSGTFATTANNQFAVRALGGIRFQSGTANEMTAKVHNSNTTWAYTPVAPSNWPVGLDNVAHALDSLSSGASVLMGPTDVTGTANNNKVVSFQTGISLNGTVASRNIGVGVGTITSVTSGVDNIGVGNNSLQNLTSGTKNIAIGTNSLLQTTTTASSIAIGANALSQATVGQQIAIGESALQSTTSGSNNLAVGTFALTANTTGGQNTALGNSALGQNTTASNNTAVGVSALNQNLTGASNTGVGSQALTSNQTGSDNSGVGKQVLLFNTASFNTAMGSESMRQNTTGTNNAAFGYQALTTATTADNTTAIGSSALRSITTGINNTAVGSSSMFNATNSNQNVAVGHDSLRALISGGGNSVAIGYQALWATTVGLQTAVGSGALQSTTTGAQNTAVGYHSMQNNTTGSLNNAFGYESLLNNTTGSPNLAFGTEALRTNVLGSNNIGIGNRALRNNVANKNIAIGHSAMESLAGSFSGNPNKPYVYIPGATATINLTTSVLTSSVAIFTSDMVGARIFLADSSNSLITVTIRQFISSTQVLVTSISSGLISLVWNNFYITIEQSSSVLQGATQTGTTLALSTFSVFWSPFSINVLGVTGDPYELIGCLVVFPDGSESTITSFVSKSNSSFTTTFTATPSRTISTINYVLITKPAIWNTTIGNNTMQLQKYGFDNVMYGDDVHKESTDYVQPSVGYTVFSPPFQTLLLGKGAASGKNPLLTTAAIRRCVMLGHQAGEQAGLIFDSIFIGKDTGRRMAGSSLDVIMGPFAGSSVKTLNSTALVGTRVLSTSQGFHDNIVAVGTNAMQNYGSGSFFNEGYLASQTGIIVTIDNGPITPRMAKGSLIIFDNRVQAETTSSLFGSSAYVSVSQTVALQKFICVGGSERYTTGTVTYYDILEVDYRVITNVLQLSGGGEFTTDMIGGLIVTSSSFIFRVNEVISPSVIQVFPLQSNIANNLIPINTSISSAFNGSGTLNVYGDLATWPNTGSFVFSAFSLGSNLGTDLLRPVVIEYTPFPASTLQVSQTTNWPTTGSFAINNDNYIYSGRTSISTTVTVGGNLTLSPSTINVSTTAGFASSGVMALVNTTNSQQYPVRYTGITATQFTGCVYAFGNLPTTLPYTTSWYVSYGTLTGIQPAFNLNYPPSIIVPTTTVQLSATFIKYNYTGKTSNTLTGCTSPTGCTIVWPVDTQVTFSYSAAITNQSYYLYYGNGTSNNNAIVGPSACQSATGGIRNSVLGARTLSTTISGSNNVTLGYKSMESISHSSYNNNDTEGVEDASSSNCVTVGSETGKNLESNSGIVAVGYKALASNNSATNCVAVGYNALVSNGETTFTLGVKFIGNKMARNQGLPSLSDSNTAPPFFNRDMVGGTVIRNTFITGYYYQETIVGYLDENTLLLSDNVINYNSFIQVRILYGKMYNIGTISQTGNVVTPAGGATFTRDMIGGNIVFFIAQANLATINRNAVYTAVIKDVDINGNLIVYPSQNIVAGTSYKIYYGGSNNTSTGHKALESSKLERNTAFGSEAGQSIVKGTRNTIVGYKTNSKNEIGYDNTVVGDNAMTQTNICYSVGTASQSGTTIIGGDGAYYTPSMVGGTIVYNNYAKAIPQITTLPSATINVDSTAQFPSSGTILVETNLSTTYSTSPSVIIPLPIAGATLAVTNTTGFPTSGTVIIICGKNVTVPPNLVTSQAVQLFPYTFTYTGKTATTLTGVTGGVSTFSIYNGATIYYKQPQVITYSGKTATSFTGCTGTNLAGQIGSTTPIYAFNKPQITISGFVNNTTLTAMSSLPSGDVVSQPYAIYFGTQYTTGTITQSSFTVTGSGTAWDYSFVGGVIIYSTGDTAQIQNVNTGLQTMIVDKEYTFGSPTTYIIHYGASSNVVIGSGAGQSLEKGGNNTLVGTQSNTSAATSKAVCVGDSSNVLGNGNVVLGQGSTDNAQNNVIVLGSGVTAASVTSGNQLVIGSGITPSVGSVIITNYINLNVGGTTYKLPIGV